MRITDVRTVLTAVGAKNCIFVLVDTDEGITGIAETVYKRKSKAVAAGIGELKRYLIGKDPTRIEEHFEKMYRDSFFVGGPSHTTPMSAVEVALWDILGKSLNAPIYKLLGGPVRDRIPVYCHCTPGATPESCAENARACVDRGYRAMKLTLPLFYGAKSHVNLAEGEVSQTFGYSGTHGTIDPSHKETEILDPDIFDRTSQFVAAARAAVGPKVQLAIDCHGRLSAANARRLVDALAPYNLMFIEEPVPPENVEALREVTQHSSTPIAAGERWSTVYDARRFLGCRAVAVAQPDVVNCGGLAQAKKIAAIAEAEYVPLAPHNPNGPLATLAAVHLAASIPNFLILETIGSDEDKKRQAELVQPALKFDNGELLLPDGPGLGAELDLDACARYPYRPFEGWR